MAEFERGNQLAVVHGAKSVQIAGRATVERRRLLRQIGLRQSDLESVGRALPVNWSRAAAALALMDDYAAREGWLKPDGEPRVLAKLYVSMLNSEWLALARLAAHLRAENRDAAGELNRYVHERYGGDAAG